MGDEDFPDTDIRSRVHTGTVNFATVLTVPAAVDLHQQIGAAAKQARLRYLRDYWVSRVRSFKDIEILTPDEAGLYGAITSFRFAGKTSKADNDATVVGHPQGLDGSPGGRRQGPMHPRDAGALHRGG
jgi:selenocysteine lyase/cysteine desulfurase